jgi:ParB/RepB/Spo0J family partition protein
VGEVDTTAIEVEDDAGEGVEEPEIEEPHEPTEFEVEAANDPDRIWHLAPDDVSVDYEFNGRADIPSLKDPEVQELIKSMEEHGQQTPVKIRLIKGVAHLVYGFRRHFAALQLQKKNPDFTLQCQVVTDMDDTTARIQNTVENSKRRELNPVDRAKVITKLMGDGMTLTKAAQTVGISKSAASFYARFHQIGEEALELMKVGKFTVGNAIECLTIKNEDERTKAIAKIVKKVGTEGKAVPRSSAAEENRAAKANEGSKGSKRTVKQIEEDLLQEKVRRSRRRAPRLSTRCLSTSPENGYQTVYQFS